MAGLRCLSFELVKHTHGTLRNVVNPDARGVGLLIPTDPRALGPEAGSLLLQGGLPGVAVRIATHPARAGGACLRELPDVPGATCGVSAVVMPHPLLDPLPLVAAKRSASHRLLRLRRAAADAVPALRSACRAR